MTRSIKSAVESLDAAVDIDHGAALLGRSAARQHNLGEFEGLIRENIEGHQRRELAEIDFAKAAVEWIFTDHHEGGDFAGGYSRSYFGKAGTGGCGGDSEELSPAGVRIAIVGDKEAIALLGAGPYIDQLRSKGLGKAARQEKLLVGHTAGGNDRRGGAGVGLERRHGRNDCILPTN